ncbi:siderophore-interacting protein [Naasia sp. SYSU D00057]|uniref:siderophore-interacting protein n=1 Tax=Naasia sp. SYSU D00057 TaxID=2817380 RepID=UPI001B30BBB4|nr:siderophore-interacting protein [Naasia sp. SYSU D00057]
MLTSLAPARPRPAYRPFRVSVRRIDRLTPSFFRVTFAGPDLVDFGTAGLDQRVKLLLPLPGLGYDHLGVDDPEVLESGDWYVRWRELPDSHRNPLRTYTVRAVRPEQGEVDVDFAAHGDIGPASAWVRRAEVGDELVIVGPDSRSEDPTVGIEWKPGSATSLLLVGDETAVPAISAILESLPAGTPATAILEVPCTDDALLLDVPASVSVTWLCRDGAPVGAVLEPAVREWIAGHLAAAAQAAAREELADIDIDSSVLWETPVEPPTAALYAWMAGEAGVIKDLRRFLVRECGLDRRQVAFMGYWREGRAEAA